MLVTQSSVLNRSTTRLPGRGVDMNQPVTALTKDSRLICISAFE